MAVVLPSAAKGHTGEIAKNVLGNVLEERVSRIKKFVDNEQAVSRDELAKFIWGTAKRIYDILAPTKDTSGAAARAWNDAKGMLKELIDWDKFKHAQCDPACINHVLEKKVVEVIDAYRNFVLTGEIKTKYPPPKLLGETDEIVVVDKPCLYTCGYGNREGVPPVRALKHLGEKASASMLLNGDKAEIQLHEYLALKYNFECAKATRELWLTEGEMMECKCGSCEKCAATQTGCCNRLDKETSGVMIVAKNLAGFPEVRRQFASEHSLEEGGTEKYYLCLVHGEVQLPSAPDERNPHWTHTVQGGRGRIKVDLAFDKKQWKSLPYDDSVWKDGVAPPEQVAKLEEWRTTKYDMTAQSALSFYEPVAWFEWDKEKYTLVLMQIITGRTHQIRFHMEQVGHPLVGDSTYGAPFSDRGWCPRVYLHSYQTKFREPFTDRWFEATSPLPQDLGEILNNNMGVPVRVKEGVFFKSRRVHDQLSSILKQYDPSIPLLFTHDAPVNKDEVMRRVAYQREVAAQGGRPGAWKSLAWGDNKGGFNTAGYPLRPEGQLCQMYERHRQCTLKATCTFHHPEELALHPHIGVNSIGLPLRPSERTVCPEYAKSGAPCSAAQNCKFNHPEDRSESGVLAAIADADRMVADIRAAAENAVAGARAQKAADIENSKWPQPPPQQQAWQQGGGANGWSANQSWENNKWEANGGWKSNGAKDWGKGWQAQANGWDKKDSNGSAWKVKVEPKVEAKAEAKAEEDSEDDWGGWTGKKEAAKKEEDDDDDAWGGWTAKKEEPEQPPAKKVKVEDVQQAQCQPMAQPVLPAGQQILQFAPFQPPAQQVSIPPVQQPVPQPMQFPPMQQPVLPLAPTASGWKRMESRSQPGIYYYWNQATNETQADPPPPWEKRESRSQPGLFYYWNPLTNTTDHKKPEV